MFHCSNDPNQTRGSDVSVRRKTHDVLQGSGTTEGVVLKLGQEMLGLVGFLLELVRVVDLLDMLLESLRVRD